MSSTVLRYRGPEEITYAEYVNNEERYRLLLSTHWERNGQWIEEEGEAFGLAWVIVCGTNIVAGSCDMSDRPSPEEVQKWGPRTNKVPFFYVITPRPKNPAA